MLFAAPLRDHAERVAEALRAAGIAPLPIEVPDAEARQDRSRSPPRCWDALGAAGFTRTDAVVGVGGGAVTDLAGFVAACWLRGVRVVQVPTSRCSAWSTRRSAARPGSTRRAGKNLVGAFHPPAGVLCDLTTLDTLPADDLAPGWPRWSSAASSPTRRSST